MLVGQSFLPFEGDDSPLYASLPVLTAATWDAQGQTLRCFTPPATATEGNESATDLSMITYKVEVTANGQQFTSDGVSFVEYPPPVLSSFTPSGGPAAGGTAIRLEGFGLVNGSEYLCRFGATKCFKN